VIAVLTAGIFVNIGVNAFEVHPECRAEGEVAIGWLLTSNRGGRLGRFRKRINTTPNAMTMAIPPMMPPAIAGAFDLRGDVEEVDNAEWEGTTVEAEGVSDVGVETINSGL
jgi:hypothetical protein